MGQISLRLNNCSLLLRNSCHLLFVVYNIDLIPFLGASPVDATGELPVRHSGRIVEIILTSSNENTSTTTIVADIIIIRIHRRVQIRSVLRLHKVVRLVGAMVLQMLGVFRT